MDTQTPIQPDQTRPQFPTEVIDLPSEGKYYNPEGPLASGRIELYYPSARSEDILTSKNLITKGLAIDKFLESLIVDPRIRMDEILMGDKNAMLVSARILAYGTEYMAEIDCPKCQEHIKDYIINLAELGTRKVSLPEQNSYGSEFQLQLPKSKVMISFRLLTHADEKAMESELKALKKMTKNLDSEITTRIKYCITSVNGNTDRAFIKKFVDNMLASDSLALRKELMKVTPDVDMKIEFICPECNYEERMTLPMGISFLWPSGEAE